MANAFCTTFLQHLVSALPHAPRMSSRMTFRYASDEGLRRDRLKPFLLFALSLAVVAFCGTLWLHTP